MPTRTETAIVTEILKMGQFAQIREYRATHHEEGVVGGLFSVPGMANI